MPVNLLECSGCQAKHTNRVTQGPAAVSLNPACPSEIYRQQRRAGLGVDSDLVVAIGWLGGVRGKVERERDRVVTLMGHTLAFNNNPEEDAP